MTNNIHLEKLASDFGFNGKIIGFSKKFYTLWEYQITRNEDTKALTFDAYFIKNIGLSNPYEGAYPFEESLKGKEIHITSDKHSGLELSKLELKALSFSKNPMKGYYIADCNDASLLCWKLNVGNVNPKHSKNLIDAEIANITNRALELHCEKIGEVWYTAEKAACTHFSQNPQRDTLIATCADDNLLCWKYNHQAVSASLVDELKKRELENIKERAIYLGAVEVKGRLYSVKQQSEQWFLEMTKNSSIIEAGEVITYEMKHNLTLEGNASIFGVVFHFENKYIPATYYGPAYCLPLDKKGKAKRVKGKTIQINSYEFVEEAAHKGYDEYGDEIEIPATSYYKVLDWEIVK